MGTNAGKCARVCFQNWLKRKQTWGKRNKRREVCPSLFPKLAEMGTNAGKKKQMRGK
ncbi:hypothetical protein HMPREF3216_00715 [Gardnerella vaginalis]|uniref:Uncharacterized protein n=1 Tax=Gardnerella vaginalis TaxID=2702 RepID=A0A133NPF7_GARVA|nr:hypothetical protein HMPREF3216_00715 [Gardnerella vaginalis]